MEAKAKTLVEGISGTWFYHLSDNGKTALCGAQAMPTGVPESGWGEVTHMKERYCKVCARLRENPELQEAQER